MRYCIFVMRSHTFSAITIASFLVFAPDSVLASSKSSSFIVNVVLNVCSFLAYSRGMFSSAYVSCQWKTHYHFLNAITVDVGFPYVHPHLQYYHLTRHMWEITAMMPVLLFLVLPDFYCWKMSETSSEACRTSVWGLEISVCASLREDKTSSVLKNSLALPIPQNRRKCQLF